MVRDVGDDLHAARAQRRVPLRPDRPGELHEVQAFPGKVPRLTAQQPRLRRAGVDPARVQFDHVLPIAPYRAGVPRDFFRIIDFQQLKAAVVGDEAAAPA